MSLLFDLGIHKTLGLRSPEGALTPPKTRPKVWEAIGISPCWTAGAILKWLEDNGWSDIELIAQPSRTRGWLAIPFVVHLKMTRVIISPSTSFSIGPRNLARLRFEVLAAP